MLQNLKKNRQKAKKFVENKSFDLFIMLLICLDALVLGLMTSYPVNENFGAMLFTLDRLCMAIFIVEMLLKLYVYGVSFFKSGWNGFDLFVITVSSFAFASYFIILRTFRLFRLLKYINRFSKLKRILKVFQTLFPNFAAVMMVFAVFLYVFAIMAVSLFGDVFMEFSTLGNSVFSLLQVFTLDGWASELARPVMSLFPHAWIFFVSFILISFLLLISFLAAVIDEIFRRDMVSELSAEKKSLAESAKQKIVSTAKKKTRARKKRMSPSGMAK